MKHLPTQLPTICRWIAAAAIHDTPLTMHLTSATGNDSLAVGFPHKCNHTSDNELIPADSVASADSFLRECCTQLCWLSAHQRESVLKALFRNRHWTGSRLYKKRNSRNNKPSKHLSHLKDIKTLEHFGSN